MTEAAVPRLKPFARFPTVFSWALRRTTRSGRFYVSGALAVAAGLGLGSIAFVQRDPARVVWEMLDDGFLGVAVPLLALSLVGGGFGEEVQDRTLLYHLVRPVSRRTVYVARYAAGVVPAAVAAAAMVLALPWAARVPLRAGDLGLLAALSALGVATVGALYYALAALFRRGLVAGLVYTFLVEGLFQFLPGSIQKLSLMHHVRSLYHRGLDGAFSALSDSVAERVRALAEPLRIDPSNPDPTAQVFRAGTREPWSSVEGALLVCAVVVVASLLLGSRAVARKDFPLKD